MNFFVLTAFPEILTGSLNQSILKKAQEKKLLNLTFINLLEFTEGKHKQLDDYPYGGGAGMVLKPEPVYRAFESLPFKKNTKAARIIYMSPQGETLNQKKMQELSGLENVAILCGRYKGVDQRIIDDWVDEEISIGDYVVSGGEIPALVLIDGISRLLPGVIGNKDSAETDSFSNGLLGYPIYTRPAEWQGKKVPDVLLSGNHKNIDKWRLERSLNKTQEVRKDLYEKYFLELEDKKNE